MNGQSLDRKKKRRLRQEGFSLIEILVVVTLLSIMSSAVFGVFSQGMNLWKRASVQNPSVHVDLLSHKIADDLRSAFFLSTEPFVGKKKQFFVTAKLKNPLARGEWKGQRQVYRLHYFFDPADYSIKRSVLGLKGIIYDDESRLKTRTVLENVGRVEFEYYNRSSQKTDLSPWFKEWDKECLPNAIKMTIDTREPKKRLGRVFEIPVGGCEE